MLTSASPHNPFIDAEHVIEALTLLHRGNSFEIRVLFKRGAPHSQYFGTPVEAAEALKHLPWRNVKGVYTTLNRIDPSLVETSKNRLTVPAKRGSTTSADDVVRRSGILVDIDPCRESDTSSTDAELKLARLRAIEIRDWLRSWNCPEPLMATSGNGYHLLLPVDLPNDSHAHELVKNVLIALRTLFPDDAVKVDQSVSDAPRIVRLCGTRVQKGIETAERPHRMATLIDAPENLLESQIYSPEHLKSIAQFASPKNAEQVREVDTRRAFSRQLNIDSYLGERGIRFSKSFYKDFEKFRLDECPFNPEHGPDSMLTQHKDGGVQFKCFHDSCRGYKWPEFKMKVGPPDASHFMSRRPERRTFFGKAAVDLWGQSYEPIVWLTKDVFSADQPTIIGAKQKTLKTTILSDLAVGLATGTSWLGRFEIPQTHRVLFITGESSEKAAIRKIARATAKRGLTQQDIGDRIRIEAINFPSLPSINDCIQIQQAVADHSIDVVIIDPLYMGMQGVNTANLTEVGPALRMFMEYCRPAKIIIAHHVKKSASYDDAPNLEDLSQAGIAEFAGNYWLMGRMTEYTGDGVHELAIRYGGRDEQFGLLRMEFNERTWHAEFSSLLQHREHQKEHVENAKVQEMKQRIVRELSEQADGLSRSKLADACSTKPSRKNFRMALSELTNSEEINRLDDFKSGTRSCVGYRIGKS